MRRIPSFLDLDPQRNKETWDSSRHSDDSEAGPEPPRHASTVGVTLPTETG
jgi:hypothetical protein